MCGIAGILRFDGAPAPLPAVCAMVRILRHRGPDGEGIFADGSLALGHARLSIIDLSSGHQPMQNADNSLCITFNGEIFNYLELREDLIRRGYRFLTRSDTEVILNLYEEYGEDCVQYLNGQWAFAIWDSKRRQLFLSRDRIGIQPLFYALTADSFLFASEIKAIIRSGEVDADIDLAAVDEIFTFWVTLPPRTICKRIQELPPGHSVVVKSGQATVRRYWQLDFSENADGCFRSEDECAQHLLELLEDATRIRLRADVPVGAYLSGGLDSTLITALIRKVSDVPLKTFSVAFADAEFNESTYQREASHFFHTDHREVRCSLADIARAFPRIVWHTEQPILRTAPAPLYMLSGLVREESYKVVLTGEGADEMFGGYDIFKEAKIRRFWGKQPDSRYRPALLARLYPYLPYLHSQPGHYLKEFFRVTSSGMAHLFFSHLPRWELTTKAKVFFSDDVKSALTSHDSYAELKAMLPDRYARWDTFSQAQYLEAAYLLPGYLLSSQGDRMLTAHSIEGRFPFLDHRVVEFASALPARWKMKVLNEKYLLKHCARHLIPECIASRPKQPYRAPDGKSFFELNSPGFLGDALSPESLRRTGLFQAQLVAKLVDKFTNGRAIGARDNMAFVGILSTQLVAQQLATSRTEQRRRRS